jgi:hypothetical protein
MPQKITIRIAEQIDTLSEGLMTVQILLLSYASGQMTPKSFLVVSDPTYAARSVTPI